MIFLEPICSLVVFCIQFLEIIIEILQEHLNIIVHLCRILLKALHINLDPQHSLVVAGPCLDNVAETVDLPQVLERLGLDLLLQEHHHRLLLCGGLRFYLVVVQNCVVVVRRVLVELSEYYVLVYVQFYHLFLV
jgi:hypothetical protein